MGLISKLPGYRPVEPGLERKILRMLPPGLAVGLAVLMIPSVMLRIVSWNLHPVELATRTAKADMYAAGFMLVHINLLVFTAFAALIIVLMKGPAYVADAYPLEESDFPRRIPEGKG